VLERIEHFLSEHGMLLKEDMANLLSERLIRWMEIRRRSFSRG
jgi:hypothetical protein